ncbi:MAG: MDR family MFS transporter [Candidatus Velthaea sp.]
MFASAPRESVIEYGFRRFVVVFAIIVATLLEIVDVTIVNVALPNIQGGLGASLDQAAWIGTGYIIANVIVIPITPWLQIRFGRKAYYLASIAIFTLASVMCGLSTSIEELIFWRIVQGLGGGGLISTSQTILRETFPADKQGAAAGIFAMGVIVGPTVGPTLGGVITDTLGWQWAFFINVPLGLLAFFLIANYLRDPEKARRVPVDVVGLVLLAAGIGSLQYVLDQGQQKDWFDDASIVMFSALAAAGLIAFVLYELFGTTKPIVDLRVLRYRSVAVGSLLGMCLGISLYGSVLILPQFVQGSLGYTATLSGELLVMRAGAILLLTPISARLSGIASIDKRWMLGFGFTVLGLSNFVLARYTTTDSGFWTFFVPLVMSGIGLSQIFVPLTVSVLSAVPPKDLSAASAFFNLSRQIGGSVAIAVLVTILARQNAVHHEELTRNATVQRPAIAHIVQRDGLAGAENTLGRILAGQSIVLAYADTARATAVITLVLAPLVLLLRRPRAVRPVVVTE